MSTVTSICTAIGRRKLANALNVGVTAVGNAVKEGRFPAKWYVVVRAQCDAVGIECPTHLFTFVAADAKQVDDRHEQAGAA